jgi:hypothetical protein
MVAVLPAVWIGAFGAQELILAARPEPTPVLVELFTSEGCSDCPPADALLAKLDVQSVPGVQAIVLSEHVDYWNHIGWTDPYSSHSYSQRQSAYDNHFGLSSVYTPQMVVDGTEQFVGSDVSRARAALERAEAGVKIPVTLSHLRFENGTELQATVEAGPLPESSHRAGVFVVVALNRAESAVAGGENSGRHLTHVAVVRDLLKVGDLKPGASFSKEVSVKVASGVGPGNVRLIAFVQEPGPGRVLGAAVEKPAR